MNLPPPDALTDPDLRSRPDYKYFDYPVKAEEASVSKENVRKIWLKFAKDYPGELYHIEHHVCGACSCIGSGEMTLADVLGDTK
jgi:hypothetical protein